MFQQKIITIETQRLDGYDSSPYGRCTTKSPKSFVDLIHEGMDEEMVVGHCHNHDVIPPWMDLLS